MSSNLFDVDKTELMRLVLDRYDTPSPMRSGWSSIRCIHPDHPDRSKSAGVNLGRGKFRCHACGLAGDGFDIMQQIEGLGVKDVLGMFGLKGAEEETEWLF